MNKENKCNHDIIFVENVFDSNTNSYVKIAKCILCDKFFTNKELENISPRYIINSEITLKDGSKETISYNLIKHFAKQLSKKYYLFNESPIPVNKLYSLLTEYFRL